VAEFILSCVHKFPFYKKTLAGHCANEAFDIFFKAGVAGWRLKPARWVERNGVRA